jgi:outer membrane protein assembly factor BamB
LEAETGEVGWTFPRDPEEDSRGVFYVAPAVSDDYIVVASETPAGGFFSQPKNVVWALDQEGRDVWSFSGANGQFVEGGAIGDGTFVIGSSDGNIYALDLDTGDLKWEFETGHRVWATPLIDGDTVYIGSMDRHLYALRVSDGEEVWSFHAPGAFASEPVLDDGTLYIGAFDDKLYAIDAATGIQRWQFSGENWFWGEVALHDGMVFAADVNGNVYAVDATTGEQRWHQLMVDDDERNAPVRAGVVLSADGGLLFVGSENGTLYALDTSDGRKVWSNESGGQLFSNVVVENGVVYEPLIYGNYRIRALHVENGREIWAYPPQTEE